MKFADLVAETTTSTSTSVITLAGAKTDQRSFASAWPVGTTDIAVYIKSGAQYEFGLYTLTDATHLTRQGSIRSSSNAGSAVTFPSGAKDVLNDVPSEFLNGLADTLDLASVPTISSLPSNSYVIVLGADGSISKTPSTNLTAASSGGTTTPTVTSVSVSPATISLSGGGSQTFTATVTGTNSPAQSVAWSASAGTITSAGVFTAPAATSSTQTITITATSTVDTSKNGTATVTIGAASSTVTGVTVGPTTASVAGGGTQTFTATVAGTNSPSQAVNWTASAGSITAGGVFTAPAATSSAQTVTITATSAQDNSKTGTATVTVAAAAAAPAYQVRTTNASGQKINGVNYFPDSNASTATLAGSSPNYFTRDTNTFVSVIKVSDGTYAPTVKFVWSKSSTQAPITYADTALPANSVNGNTLAYTDAVVEVGVIYGNTHNAVSYLRGTPGTYYLWALTSDGGVAVYDNGTGTPIGWTVTAPAA